MRMRISLRGAKALLFVVIPLTVPFNTAAALAQQAMDPSNSSFSSLGAPVYSQNNFESDARANNLYSYKNPVATNKTVWNNFQMQLKQTAAQGAMQAQQMQPQASSPSSQVGGYNGGLSALTGLTGLLLTNPYLLNKVGGNKPDDENKTPDGTAGPAATTPDANIDPVPGLVPQ
jgi:hypothetical protein